MKKTAILLSALLLGACFEAAPGPDGDAAGEATIARAPKAAAATALAPPALPEMMVSIGAVNEGLEPPPLPAVFDIDATRQLYVYSRVRNMVGVHDARVEVLSPDGHVYDIIKRRFSMSSALADDVDRTAAPGPRRSGPGGVAPQLPAKVLVAPWEKVFWWKLQLKGTPIVRRQMVGQWTLRAFLDGENTPSSEASFTLERS